MGGLGRVKSSCVKPHDTHGVMLSHCAVLHVTHLLCSLLLLLLLLASPPPSPGVPG